jgi:hypothetical protein
MQVSDLQAVIDLVLQGLQTNNDVMTPALITKIETILPNLEAVITELFGVDAPKIIMAIQNAVAIEKKLSGGLTVTITDALTKLKSHPMVMHAIANFVIR